MSDNTKLHFENSIPILYVEDMSAAVRYYEDALGFKNESWGNEYFTGIYRDSARLYLARGEQGHKGTWVWLGVSDAQELYEELKAKGARVRHAPRNYPWALEFHVEDVDGHILRMGSEPIEDRSYDPFMA